MDFRLALFVTLASGCLPHTPAPRWDDASKELCQGRVCFRVGKLGSAWQAVHREAASIGFYNAGLGGIVEANATCRDDAEATPLTNLTSQLLIGYTERQVREQVPVQLAAREALRTTVDAKLDGVPVTLQLYVLKRNGCIFDLSYGAPPAHYASGTEDFERFVQGFIDERKR